MRRRRMAVLGSVVVGCLLAVAAVVPAIAATRNVTIAGFAYSPDPLVIRVGDKVTWTNQDAASHTATGSSSGFDTGTISTGRSKSITFNAVGTYAYHCTIHPTMTGTVVVRASSAGNAPNTDTAALDPGHDDTWLSIVLATLGVVMLVGTLVVERLLRRRAT